MYRALSNDGLSLLIPRFFKNGTDARWISCHNGYDNTLRGHLLSKLDELQFAMMGDMDECRMSLYGIHRLLNTRTMGAAQLMPALDGLDVMAREHCRSIERFIACLSAELLVRQPSQQRWRSLVEGIGKEARALLEAIVDAVAERGRLGAKARLDLEERVARLGVRLEAQRAVSMAVVQALRQRARLCQLCDLFGASNPMAGTFGARTVDLFLLDRGDPPMLMAEAVRLVLHQELCWLADNGHDKLAAWWRRDAGLAIVVRSAAAGAGPSSSRTVEHVCRPLRATTPYETHATALLADQLSIVVERGDAGVTVTAPEFVARPAPGLKLVTG